MRVRHCADTKREIENVNSSVGLQIAKDRGRQEALGAQMDVQFACDSRVAIHDFDR